MKKVLLLIVLVKKLVFGNNLTREECLTIERTNSVRRSAKIVNAVENNPAYLHCVVGSNTKSPNYLVAWTRLSDDALLTVGERAFASDARFQISPKRQTRDWVLLIRRIQKSDEGCYLCEINTEPLSTLIPVYLSVIPIQETPKRLFTANTFTKRSSKLIAQMDGDSIVLNCTVFALPEINLLDDLNAFQHQNGEYKLHHHESANVLWTKDNMLIEFYDKTKYGTELRVTPNGVVVHILRIAQVTADDDGLYACEGENLTRSAQMVHINASNTSPTLFNFYESAFLYLFKTLILSKLLFVSLFA